MRSSFASAWLPAGILSACLLVAGVAGMLGHRAMVRSANEQLAVAGQYAAHHIGEQLLSRLRALESIAAVDAAALDGGTRDDPDERDARRRVMIGSLARLYPELLWIGFAEPPGRVSIALRDLLAGRDVSARPWWTAGLRGPFIGDAHEAVMLADLLDRPRPSAEPLRLLDIAVPLRGAGGAPQGVLAAHVDVAWLRQMRADLADVADRLEGIEMTVLLEGGDAIGRKVELGSEPADGRPLSGAVDGEPRLVSVHPIGGDVVVRRLGWRVAVSRARDVHERIARRFLAWSLAVGAMAGIAAAAGAAAAAHRATYPA